MAAVEEGEMGFEAAFDNGVCVGQGTSAAGTVDGGSGEQKRRDMGLMWRRRTEAVVFPLPTGGGHRRRPRGLEEEGERAKWGIRWWWVLKFVGHMVVRIWPNGPVRVWTGIETPPRVNIH